jgi:predicted transposase YbfD/YdcC
VQQVCVIERVRRIGDKEERETSFAITSLGKGRAGAKWLLQIARSHWEIENRVHYVRDATMGEDACRVRTGSAPAVLAGMRNACLRLLRSSGVGNVAEALRRQAAHPQEALDLVREFIPPDL